MSQSNGAQTNGSTQPTLDGAKQALTDASSKAKEPLANSKNPKSKPGITYAAQDKLPQLPIPDLESSCKKYLKALEPLQSARQNHESQLAIQEFLKEDGPGLQAKLKEYAKGKSNYIEQFCEYWQTDAR